MFYQFLYIIWRIFWSSIWVLLLTVTLFSGIIFLLLQTQPVREYLTERAEYWFNENFQGTLRIGSVGGLLPLNVEIREVTLSLEGDKLVDFESLNISADLIALLRNHLSINDIALHRPVVHLEMNDSGRYTIAEAFRQKSPDESGEIIPSRAIRTFDIYAPFVRVNDASVTVASWPEGSAADRLTGPVHITNFHTEMFLEISADLRYLDINHIVMQLPDWDSRELILSGQIFNDSQYLELNAMQLQLGESHFVWNSEFTGINLYEEDITRQFREASWLTRVDEAFLSPDEAGLLVSGLPDGFPGISASFQGDGQGDVLNLSNVLIHIGNSMAGFNARLNQPGTRSLLSYEVMIDELRITGEELELFWPQTAQIPYKDWTALVSAGSVQGTADTLELDMSIDFPGGNVSAIGGVDLQFPYALEIVFQGSDLRLHELEGFPYPESSLNAELLLVGSHLTEPDSKLQFSVDIFDSKIGRVAFPDLHIDAELTEQVIRHEFAYHQDDRLLTGQGHIDFRSSVPNFSLQGRSAGLNLNEMVAEDRFPYTDWNMNFNINWNGLDMADWHGRIILDVEPSVINGNEVSSHQMYLDLNRPDSEIRSLRLTSTIMDVMLEGDMQLPAFPALYKHWKNYFTHRIQEEILFQTDELTSLSTPVMEPDHRLNLDLILEIKDYGLLKNYLPDLPDFSSSAQLAVQMETDRDSLGLHARWSDDKTTWEGWVFDESDITLSAGFRIDQPIRNVSSLEWTGFIGRLETLDRNMEQIDMQMILDNGSLYHRSRINNFGNNVRFEYELEGLLSDTLFTAEIQDLVFGNDRYLWQMAGRPVIRYDKEQKWHVDALNLISGNDQIYIDGTFSESVEDSVEYRFQNVDLERISHMIGGRLQFEGILNGEFVTKNLFEVPVLHGNISIEYLAFGGRTIGDADLSSSYNPAENRFDTQLKVHTDPARYSDYLERNNGVGQDITAQGWIRAPGVDVDPSDSLYYFDVDVRQIDGWVLTYLLHDIFETIEGRASGSGYFTGNFNYIDFGSDFQVEEVSVVPVFFDTEYILQGEVSVGRREGVLIHRLDARDAGNGTGVVTGRYDFNDFQPEKNMDITLRMNNLRFLDNSEGPDVPFYGRVAGSGVVNISGTNAAPFVRTTEPVYTTSQSRLSIPLADQITDSDQGRFIRFVKDFNEADISRRLTESPEVLRQLDRSFMEVFRLDLQFVAAPNSTVQLIFDPVTGEIVNARGSGRVRITLEDETLQIFGNYDIIDGDYLFVGGDIITRRFTLREGGSIRWDGDPVNARLDITAVYRARPNIAPLLGAAGDQANRVPVELLLEITGPIDNIENDFYFEFPNAIDATQNAAVLNILNSEEQKLIQATSLLFTGGFISGGLVGDTQTQELGSTLQARAGQVGISQLLSSQINALLSDNLMNLDVDINLFGFDQADLGIALRLFDDRLVLRREGEVGGEDANIGDLGATYRINPNLSVEVFHRKDPMLMSILGAQAEVENVNGVGLEAQFRFNTWREFGQTVWRNLTTGFGLWGQKN